MFNGVVKLQLLAEEITGKFLKISNVDFGFQIFFSMVVSLTTEESVLISSVTIGGRVQVVRIVLRNSLN